MAEPKAILFDVFGTVVDWRGGLIDQLTAFGEARALIADWPALVDAWRRAYIPSMDQVRRGELPWTNLEMLQRTTLEQLAVEQGIEGLGASELDRINRFWRRLPPWPDSREGLVRLKRRFVIATLSNGNVALLVEMARAAGLPWDTVFSAEIFRRYKPDRETYLGACELLGLEPGEVMMCAAHRGDLIAAREQGLRTAYISRPLEHGPGRSLGAAPAEPWEHVCNGLEELAERLGA